MRIPDAWTKGALRYSIGKMSKSSIDTAGRSPDTAASSAGGAPAAAASRADGACALPAAEAKALVLAAAAEAGFCRARILAPYDVREDAGDLGRRYPVAAPALLVVALSYGNDDPDRRGSTAAKDDARAGENAEPGGEGAGATRPDALGAPVAGSGLPFVAGGARIAAFARRDYYAEAVARLKALAKRFKPILGGTKNDYRILCNSPIPEKPLAEACGLGRVGRNSLIITPEAGSLVVLAALTLPVPLQGDGPIGDASTRAVAEDPAEVGGRTQRQPGAGMEGRRGPAVADAPRAVAEEPGSVCGACSACVAACPTGALDGKGNLDRTRCLQAWASKGGEPPPAVSEAWGAMLYGCSACLHACPFNRRSIVGATVARGALPAETDAEAILAMEEETLAARLRDTALGMRWLGPATVKRNAALSLRARSPR